jgi:16S rRNA G527 N7-methylase RsmG
MDASGTSFELNAHLAEADVEPLDEQTVSRFCDYVSLYIRWNARLNLSAIRDEKASFPGI